MDEVLYNLNVARASERKALCSRHSQRRPGVKRLSFPFSRPLPVPFFAWTAAKVLRVASCTCTPGGELEDAPDDPVQVRHGSLFLLHLMPFSGA